MTRWDASETDAHEDPTESYTPRGLPTFAKALIALGVVAILVAAYVAFVWLPHANRKLLEYDLKKFALLYHEYNAAHDRSPSSLDDLEAFTPEDTLGINPPETYDAPRAFEMIRSGRFIIIWDAELLPDGDQNEKYVLGYERNASEDGGLVMRAGGSVRYLTAEQFKALPKIKTRGD
jgi:hypothetical protein